MNPRTRKLTTLACGVKSRLSQVLSDMALGENGFFGC